MASEMTASQFNTLKTRLNNELSRRIYRLNVSGRKETTKTATSGSIITADVGKTVVDTLLSVEDMQGIKKAQTGEMIPPEFNVTNMNTILADLESDTRNGNTHCRGDCVGMCKGSCQGNCASSCSGSCTGMCNGCSGGCYSGCSGTRG